MRPHSSAIVNDCGPSLHLGAFTASLILDVLDDELSEPHLLVAPVAPWAPLVLQAAVPKEALPEVPEVPVVSNVPVVLVAADPSFFQTHSRSVANDNLEEIASRSTGGEALRDWGVHPLDLDDFEGPLGRGLFTQAVVGQPPETNSI